MPQADGDPEVVLHAFAENEPIGLVDLVGQFIARFEAAEGDALRHLREEVLCHGLSSLSLNLELLPPLWTLPQAIWPARRFLLDTARPLG